MKKREDSEMTAKQLGNWCTVYEIGKTEGEIELVVRNENLCYIA